MDSGKRGEVCLDSRLAAPDLEILLVVAPRASARFGFVVPAAALIVALDVSSCASLMVFLFAILKALEYVG